MVTHNADVRAGRRRRQKQQGAARCRVTDRDDDDDKTQHASRTGEKEQAHTIFMSGTTVRGNTRSRKRAKCRMQTDRGAQGVKARNAIRTKPSISIRKGCRDTERR
jgi:hypothetical protein